MLIVDIAAGIAHQVTCCSGDFPSKCFDVSGLLESGQASYNGEASYGQRGPQYAAVLGRSPLMTRCGGAIAVRHLQKDG